MSTKRQMTDSQRQLRKHLRLAFLIGFHIVVCCVSLIYISNYKYPMGFAPQPFHIFYDPAQLFHASIVVAAFALVASFFVLADFSFGYLVGFFFFTMILGYLWLNCFTDLNYDHRLAGLSAAASAVAFLLTSILILCIATIAIGAIYNFRIVALENIYDYREKLDTPAFVRYLVTIISNALLPFAFAGFVAIKARWRAAAVLGLLLFFYPITLSKTAFFAPFWLIAVLVLSKIFEARITVILLLLGPMLAGLAMSALLAARAAFYFSTVNFRMIAIPSVAMDVYNDFFSRHELTHFCQISILKQIMPCPYQEQLSIVMQQAYRLGNFNASLFATEGIASVGSFYAPLTVLVCGFVFALGNRLSAGLPSSFILISGALFPQTLLNVPLTTALLTHGAGFLFLLWYITPRAMFDADNRAEPFGNDSPVNIEAGGHAPA
jgi:hypothetical protein